MIMGIHYQILNSNIVSLFIKGMNDAQIYLTNKNSYARLEKRIVRSTVIISMTSSFPMLA